jgi:type IV secretion system protein VirB6
MAGCAAQPDGTGIVSTVTRFVDCQTETFVFGAYQSLASPGSTLSVLLTAFLTILIALLGYNLLLGKAPSLRSGTLTMAKIGVVLALATSWPAYQTLVYDIAVNGPDEIASEIGRGSGVPGSDGTLKLRLDAVDSALIQLAILGPGPYAPDAQTTARNYLPPPPFVGFNAMALGISRILFLIAALGSLVAIRVVAGLALALGPFFVAFLLFSHTRSLFEGWIRVLAGTAFASLIVFVVLGLELALIEPWIAQALAIRAADQPLPSMPSELLVIVTLFGLVLAAAIFGAMRLAGAFRLAPILEIAALTDRSLLASGGRQYGRSAGAGAEEERARTRSAALADHLTRAQAREMALASSRHPTSLTNIHRGPAEAGSTAAAQASATGGRTPSARRTHARVTASARRRDIKE